MTKRLDGRNAKVFLTMREYHFIMHQAQHHGIGIGDWLRAAIVDALADEGFDANGVQRGRAEGGSSSGEAITASRQDSL